MTSHGFVLEYQGIDKIPSLTSSLGERDGKSSSYDDIHLLKHNDIQPNFGLIFSTFGKTDIIL